jgi:3-hydroxybutyryl-CoA dehydrogenase
MGSGIAASAALAGHEVVLFDSDPKKAADGVDAANNHIRQLVDGGLVADEDGAPAQKRVTCEIDLKAAVAGAFWVIEAITENLAAKQALFRTLEANVGRDVILTSNTSGLLITDIVRDVKWRDRTATTHFWFPGHLVPLVEIVMGNGTDEAVAVRLRQILQAWGKAPVIVRKDLPGQLANRILQAIIREASAIVESGLASAEDVDTAVKMGMGLRFPAWGPLEHVDTVGLELCLSVQDNVLPSLHNEPRATPMFRRLVAEGNSGVKAGKGFHDWTVRSHRDLVAQRDRFLIQALKFLGLGSSGR